MRLSPKLAYGLVLMIISAIAVCLVAIVGQYGLVISWGENSVSSRLLVESLLVSTAPADKVVFESILKIQENQDLILDQIKLRSLVLGGILVLGLISSMLLALFMRRPDKI